MNDEDFVTVFDAEDDIEANMVKDILETNGIPAVLVGEASQGILPLHNAKAIQVQVRPEDAASAEPLILEFEETGRDS